MNISAWDIYLFTRLNALNIFADITLGVGAAVVAMALFYGFMEEEVVATRFGKKLLPWLALPLLITLFVPSTKEMAAIYLIPRIASSNSANNILAATDNATALLREKMGEWLSDQLEKGKK